MKPETLEALRGSIRKWERIVSEGGEEAGAHNCPLCAIFMLPESVMPEEECVGCPVYAITGKKSCLGTPYTQWSENNGGDGPPYNETQLAIARREVAFLKGLLPKEGA